MSITSKRYILTTSQAEFLENRLFPYIEEYVPDYTYFEMIYRNPEKGEMDSIIINLKSMRTLVKRVIATKRYTNRDRNCFLAMVETIKKDKQPFTSFNSVV